MLTLLFRIDEKVATPTSVILMGVNTVVGFAYREFGQGGVEEDAWGFLAVCAPIVVFGAPFGSFVGSHFHRLTLAGTSAVMCALTVARALSPDRRARSHLEPTSPPSVLTKRKKKTNLQLKKQKEKEEDRLLRAPALF